MRWGHSVVHKVEQKAWQWMEWVHQVRVVYVQKSCRMRSSEGTRKKNKKQSPTVPPPILDFYKPAAAPWIINHQVNWGEQMPPGITDVRLYWVVCKTRITLASRVQSLKSTSKGLSFSNVSTHPLCYVNAEVAFLFSRCLNSVCRLSFTCSISTLTSALFQYIMCLHSHLLASIHPGL